MARTGSPNKYLPKTIRTVNLQKEDIPNKNADWSEIGRFALTFDAVKELGTEDIPSSVATTTTGTVSRARVRDAHNIPPVPKVGVGKVSL